jgi:hypothetical protein
MVQLGPRDCVSAGEGQPRVAQPVNQRENWQFETHKQTTPGAHPRFAWVFAPVLSVPSELSPAVWSRPSKLKIIVRQV